MSDFLSRLVMRSLGSTDVVRPRLASLFEPLPDSGTSSIVMLDQPSGLDDLVDGRPPEAPEITHVVPTRPAPLDEPSGGEAWRPPVASESPRDRPSSVEDVGEAHPPAALDVTRVVPAQPAPVEALPGRDVEKRRDVVPPASDSPKPTTDIRLVLTSRIVSVPGETGVEARPREVLARPAARVPAVSHAAPVVVRPPQIETVRRAGGDGSWAHPVPVHDEVVTDETSSISRPPAPSEASRGATLLPSSPRVASAATVVVQPRVAAYVQPARSPRTEAGVTPEPTIHVTIGRVEVRAVQPAAPTSRRERRAPAAMSLEEYLRRRARVGEP